MRGVLNNTKHTKGMSFMLNDSFTINAPIKVSHEQLGNLLCSIFNVFDLPTRYWSIVEVAYRPTQEEIEDKSKYGDYAGYPYAMVNHRNFKIRVITEDETKIFNLADLKKGMQVMADKYPHYFNHLINPNNHSSDYDFMRAERHLPDVFLQCCFYGEVLYS